MRVGNLRQCTSLAEEYRDLALADEKAALLLEQSGHHRHAMYFRVQAMEKHVRAKIFTLVNPNLKWVRDKNRSHSLEEAVEFLLEVLTSDPVVREQVRVQICEQVLGGLRFSHLHNDLRYPFYSDKWRSFSVLEVSEPDSKTLSTQLAGLKVYLGQLDRLR